MKPNFALVLSPDGIKLLHRAIQGWLMVGEVALDDPALTRALARLRQGAADLDPAGIATKLVLPEDQILYTTVSAPGRSEAQRRAQITAALDGRTPYALDEIAFDWAGTGPDLQVAAVARETLAEAESFAAEHGFNPVCFVAMPQDGQFAGEPFFGAATRLPAGTTVARDTAPTRIVGHAVLRPPSGAETDAPSTTTKPAARPGERRAETATETATTRKSAPTTTTQAGTQSRTRSAPTPEAGTAPELPGTPAPKSEAEAEVEAAPQTEPGTAQEARPTPAMTFSSRRRESGGEAASGDGAGTRGKPPTTRPRAALPQKAPATRRLTPRLPERRPRVKTAGTGAAAQPASATAGTATEATPRAPAAPPAYLAPDPVAQPHRKTPGAPGSGTPAEVATPPESLRPPSEAEALGSLAPRGTLPRRGPGLALVLALTLGAILLLAAIWAGLAVLSRDAAGKGGSGEGGAQVASKAARAAAPPIVEPLPGPGPGPEDASPSASQAAAPTAPATEPGVEPSAGAATRAATPPPAPPREGAHAAPAPGTGASPALPVDPATRLVPATIRLHKAPAEPTPVTPHLPAPLVLPDIAAPQPLRVAPLQEPAATTAAFHPPVNPAPYGTQYDLGSDGLVKPTAKGAASPYGTIVYSSRPPKVPPPRPDSAPRAAGAPAQPPQSADTQSAAAAPAPAPPGQPGAGIRPAPRPAPPPATDGTDTPPGTQPEAAASPLAVASSPVPPARPTDLSKAVAAAMSAASARMPNANDPESRDAEPEPRKATPRLPTKASVAKRATVKNALDLNRLSLLGVFGKASNRKALLRMPGGRIVRVKVGDRIAGGKIAAIGQHEVHYVKNGRSVVLAMPKG